MSLALIPSWYYNMATAFSVPYILCCVHVTLILLLPPLSTKQTQRLQKRLTLIEPLWSFQGNISLHQSPTYTRLHQGQKLKPTEAKSLLLWRGVGLVQATLLWCPLPIGCYDLELLEMISSLTFPLCMIPRSRGKKGLKITTIFSATF